MKTTTIAMGMWGFQGFGISLFLETLGTKGFLFTQNFGNQSEKSRLGAAF